MAACQREVCIMKVLFMIIIKDVFFRKMTAFQKEVCIIKILSTKDILFIINGCISKRSRRNKGIVYGYDKNFKFNKKCL